MDDVKYEIAVKTPEGVSETTEETDIRMRAHAMYRETYPHPLCGEYEAGWKAAKARYEVKR